MNNYKILYVNSELGKTPQHQMKNVHPYNNCHLNII